METDDLYLIGDRRGFTPQIGRLVSMMGYARHTLLEDVAGLSIDALDYLHDAESNSIGALLSHIAAVDHWYHARTFLGRDLDAGEMREWGAALDLGPEEPSGPEARAGDEALLTAALRRSAAALPADEAAALAAFDEAGRLHDPESLDAALRELTGWRLLAFLEAGARGRLRDAARIALRRTSSPGTLRLASAVLGTHTHVPTADARVFPKGTAFQTDVGMTGAYAGVIGMQKEGALRRFLTGLPTRFEPADEDLRLDAAVVDVDPASGRAIAIHTVQKKLVGAGVEE